MSQVINLFPGEPKSDDSKPDSEVDSPSGPAESAVDATERRRQRTIWNLKKNLNSLPGLSEGKILELYQTIINTSDRSRELLRGKLLCPGGVHHIDMLQGLVTVRDALKMLFERQLKELKREPNASTKR